ncbi:MAG: hypothetical protein JO247_01290 [Chloroflexi bacterium]|nr:hypothetical protein [Chloroflexota bacterium]
MSAAWVPQYVHLNGSVGLDTAVDVFQACGRILGRRLKRVPDGEPGVRRSWIGWQDALLRSTPYLVLENPELRGGRLRLTEGTRSEDVHFGELSYAREARTSYRDLLDVRAAGLIDPGIRFQVSLPTPLEVLLSKLSPEDFMAVEPAYERSMLQEVERICAAIPHSDLAIQWDLFLEMALWDGSSPRYRWPLAEDRKTAIVSRVAKLASQVPDDVELGLHLCYGGLGGKNLLRPQSMEPMIDFANTLVQVIPRTITWLHLPVRVDALEESFYSALQRLDLTPGTELFVGVVHEEDGVGGAQARMALARRYAPEFGVATECGMARSRTSATVLQLLETHAQVTRPPA